MKQHLKHIIQTIVVGAFVLILSVTCWFKAPTARSVNERRPLAQFPEASVDTIFNGTSESSFMTKFETYTQDQFPMRDEFRTLKALSVFHLFGQKDNNDYYVHNGVISQMNHTIEQESIDYVLDKFQSIYDEKLKDSNSHVYLSIIPDKNHFTAGPSGHLALDYDAFCEQFRSGMPYAEYIDILPLLNVEDYYATDTHWKQESITDVADTLVGAMGSQLPSSYNTHTSDTPFYGVYYGQAAMPVAPDTLSWLTNDTIDALTAFNYGTNSDMPLYHPDKLEGNDPYEFFLSGGKTAPITIHNPHAATDKELVVFRDSFGSSIAPLLAQGYKTVTLIDLRQTQTKAFDYFVDFKDKDVLFLYSTLVLNNNIEGGEKFL